MEVQQTKRRKLSLKEKKLINLDDKNISGVLYEPITSKLQDDNTFIQKNHLEDEKQTKIEKEVSESEPTDSSSFASLRSRLLELRRLRLTEIQVTDQPWPEHPAPLPESSINTAENQNYETTADRFPKPCLRCLTRKPIPEFNILQDAVDFYNSEESTEENNSSVINQQKQDKNRIYSSSRSSDSDTSSRIQPESSISPSVQQSVKTGLASTSGTSKTNHKTHSTLNTVQKHHEASSSSNSVQFPKESSSISRTVKETCSNLITFQNRKQEVILSSRTAEMNEIPSSSSRSVKNYHEKSSSTSRNIPIQQERTGSSSRTVPIQKGTTGSSSRTVPSQQLDSEPMEQEMDFDTGLIDLSFTPEEGWIRPGADQAMGEGEDIGRGEAGKERMTSCPMCQVVFDQSCGGLEIDAHLAQCLSAAGDDVAW